MVGALNLGLLVVPCCAVLNFLSFCDLSSEEDGYVGDLNRRGRTKHHHICGLKIDHFQAKEAGVEATVISEAEEILKIEAQPIPKL